MAISQGSYTIGSGGNYATVAAFMNDIIHNSNLAGSITGTLISNTTEPNTNITRFVKFNNKTIRLTSNKPHNGVVANGWKITMPANYGFGFYATSGGNVIMDNLVMEYNRSVNAGTLFSCYVDSNTYFFNYTAYNNIYLINKSSNFSDTTGWVVPSSYGTGNGGYAKIYRNIFYFSNYPSVTLISSKLPLLFENNTIINGSTPSTCTISAAQARNNLLYNVSANIGIVSQYNAANTNILPVDGTNLNNVALSTSGDAFIESYSTASDDFLKLKNDCSLVYSGTSTISIAENTTGIRGNVSPNTLNQMSIGADQNSGILPPVDLGGITLQFPQYPYTTEIQFSWDKIGSRSNQHYYFDNGATYDKRIAKATFLFTAAEAEQFKTFWDTYKASYSSTPIDLTLDSSSGWFPFGQDKGNRGTFEVEVNALSKMERSLRYFNMYEITLEFINVGAYPDYTFVTEIDEGSFYIKDSALSLSPVSNIRTPDYTVTGDYAVETVQNEGFTNYNRTIELNGDTETSKFTLVTNLSKMQRLLKLLTDNRTNTYNISDGGGNIFGYSFSTVQTNLYLLDNKFTVTANKFNEYQIDLRFTK